MRFHTYKHSDRDKSAIYKDLLPLINSGRVELLDHQKLVTQLCGLERRTARGGRDSIDHAPGAHDDLINAAAGALTLVALKPPLEICMVPPPVMWRPNPFSSAELGGYS